MLILAGANFQGAHYNAELLDAASHTTWKVKVACNVKRIPCASLVLCRYLYRASKLLLCCAVTETAVLLVKTHLSNFAAQARAYRRMC